MPCRIVPTEPPRAGDSSRPSPSPTGEGIFVPPPALALSCRRRGTAERWMRSNTLPSAKPRLREKRLIRQPSAATFSHRRRHICTPPVLAFFPADLPSAIPTSALRLAFSCRRRGTAPRWMRSSPPLPPTSRLRTLRLLLLEKGDRVAVDEECVPSPADLPSPHPSPSPVGEGGTA